MTVMEKVVLIAMGFTAGSLIAGFIGPEILAGVGLIVGIGAFIWYRFHLPKRD